MKIWFDILTPKQLLFAELLIGRLKKNNVIICTSRDYHEVKKLAKIRGIKLIFVGKHGGVTNEGKLYSSIHRMKKLFQFVIKEKPDVLISFCSPEASRVAFGLGIRHIAFTDSPHATAVMKLCLPFVSKLLTPWIIPKKEFTQFGIEEKNIIHYKTIDAAVTIKREIIGKIRLPLKKNRKTMILRLEEDQASYANKNNKSLEIAKRITDAFPNENIIILARYDSQIKKFKKHLQKNVSVIRMTFDGKSLLNNSDVFIGSSGTMTAEAALLGIPTISYRAVPNIIEDYLIRKKLIIKETNPEKIPLLIKRCLTVKKSIQVHNKKIVNAIEEPYKKLRYVMNQ